MRIALLCRPMALTTNFACDAEAKARAPAADFLVGGRPDFFTARFGSSRTLRCPSSGTPCKRGHRHRLLADNRRRTS
jgi:hypothetical protein